VCLSLIFAVGHFEFCLDRFEARFHEVVVVDVASISWNLDFRAVSSTSEST
jgi:hypothetical protein